MRTARSSRHSKWCFIESPVWAVVSGVYGGVGVHATVKYPSGYSKKAFLEAKEAFLAEAVPIAMKEVGHRLSFKPDFPRPSFEAGFPSRWGDYETQAFWYR